MGVTVELAMAVCTLWALRYRSPAWPKDRPVYVRMGKSDGTFTRMDTRGQHRRPVTQHKKAAQMTNKITQIGGTNGKGGNFVSRPNPFGASNKVGRAPECAGAKTFGMVVDQILSHGCAVLLGHTRDGGALVCTILDGEVRHRSYASSEQELDDMMLSLHEYFTGA